MSYQNKLVVTKSRAEQLLTGMLPRMRDILPKHLTPERMIRVMNNAISRNPKLLQCSEFSLCASIMTASEFGLEPNTPMGMCHIIPYKDQAQFQIGYQGLLDLVRRSGVVRNVYAEVVYQQDEFRYALGLNRTLEHVPARGDRGAPIGYYAVAVLNEGDPQFVFMTADEVDAHGRRYSKSYSKPDGPWKTHFEGMALKTVMIRLCKYLPKSIDDKLAKAVAFDTATDQGIPLKAMHIDIPASSVPVADDPQEEPDSVAARERAICSAHDSSKRSIDEWYKEHGVDPKRGTDTAKHAALDELEMAYTEAQERES